jgi:alpha-D-ribose 1-methylphosphonate 5-triphosphate synthase subunit PhnH
MNPCATLPGFSNPVEDAQTVFRAVLSALSRPGIPMSLAVCPPPLPVPGFSQGMLALALALCDMETPLWLDAAADTPEARHHLRFHCSAPFAANPRDSSFAFIAQPACMPRLREFNPGLAAYPGRSATLVISADFSAANSQVMELTGPGVRDNARGAWQSFHLSGLAPWFWEDWEANVAAYPLGVDSIFVDQWTESSGSPVIRLLGLPRTARVRPVRHGSAVSSQPQEERTCM